MTAIPSQPPPPQDRAPPKPSIQVLGLDAKVHQLAAQLVKPRGSPPAFGGGESYVAIHVAPQKELYVRINVLAQVLGVTENDIKDKTSVEVAKLIENHNHIVSEVNSLAKSFASVHPKMEAYTSSLVKFTINQLKGREAVEEALTQLKVVSEKIETLIPAILAGETGSFYVGKHDLEPSLLVSDGKIYLGGPEVGKGSFTKVSALKSLPTDSFVGVKAVGRGVEGVRSLEENLHMIEKLNRLGIPNITPTHRMKVYTKTKLGEEKLVALVSKLDGDGTTLVNFNVNPIHICKALIDVSDALAGMHKNQYVHSDVKPGNLLMRGDIKLAPRINSRGQLETIKAILHDFGGSGKTGEKANTYSPSYTSPEVVHTLSSGQVPDLAPEQDVFSFGVVVFEMATGELDLQPDQIFASAENDGEILGRINQMKLQLTNLASITPADRLLRVELLTIAERLLKVNPNDRMTMKAASAELRKVLTNHFQDIAKSRVEQKLQEIENHLI